MDDRWVNKMVGWGIFYTRFIASWNKVAGPFVNDRSLFITWLRQLRIDGKPLTDEQVDDIAFLKDNGKLELETNVRMFLTEANLIED
jgi:hypothetical protein